MNTPLRRRAVLVALAGLAGATATAACAAPGRQADPVELVWATGRITANEGPAAVAALWNAEHPGGPRVRVEALPPGADEQRQLLALEVGAGLTTFDVLDLDVIWTAEFAERGWIRDLDALRPELEEATLPRPIRSAIWKDTLWAAPYTTDVGLLYYRKDLLEEDPLSDGPPRTWEELAEVGSRIADQHGMAAFVADGEQYEGLTVQFLEYLWSAGGELLDPDGRTVALRTEPTRRALRFMADGYASGLFARGYDTLDLERAWAVFQSGGAVFMRSWPYAFGRIEADAGSPARGRTGLALLPTFEGRSSVRSTPALGGHNLAVSSHSRRPEEATEFIRFVATSPEVARLLADRSLAPTLRSAYATPADDPVQAALAKARPLARPRPPAPAWPALSEEIQQQVFATYTGTQDVDTAIAGLRTVLASITEER